MPTNLRRSIILSFFTLITLSLMACTGSEILTPEAVEPTRLEQSANEEQNSVLTPALPGTVSADGAENLDPNFNNLEIVYSKAGNLWISSSGQLTQLTDAGRDSHPRISKDNTLIAFQRGDELWAMDVNGDNQRKLYAENGLSLFQFEFIADTHKLIFSTSGTDGQPKFDLNLVDMDQGQIQQLLPEGGGGKFTPLPDWKMLALVQPGKILSYSFETHKSIQTYQMQPVKSKSGDYLAPVTWIQDVYNTIIPAANGKPALFLFLPAAGGKPGKLAEFNPVSPTVSDSYLSPDGSRILYLKAQADNLEMHVVDASTADRTFLRKPIGKIGILGWNPDSTNMLFWVDDPQYVYESDGMKVTRLSESIKASVSNIFWLDNQRCLVLSGTNLLLVIPGQSSRLIDTGVDDFFDAVVLQ